ncbi:MAG: HlyD family efflux transporter periplasmic adaptor subunit [Syntrophomonas sp.]|nr:HlyD family efflux transporter periplasmic adaptor subunit [Syntrophomonas sp.]
MSSRKARLKRQLIKKSALKIGILSFVILLLLGFIYQLGQNVYSTFIKLNRDIIIAEYGQIQDKLNGQAIVLNQEELVMAEWDGHFENMARDGEKSSKGALLGYYVGSQGSTPLYTPISGIFIKQTDGLEQVFNAIDINTVSPEIFQYKTRTPAKDLLIRAGQPVYKIVNNLQPTRLLVQFPLDKIGFEITAEQRAHVFMTEQDFGTAYIKEIKQDSDKMLIILEFDNFREELLNQRYIEVEVVFNSYAGYLIPEKALLEREGQKGILCTKEEVVIFKPLEVIKIKEGKAIVKGLNDNDMLIVNPGNYN